MPAGHVSTGSATLGMRLRWSARLRTFVKCLGNFVEFLVGFVQCQQFEQRVECQFQQWQCQQQQ